MKFPIAYVLLLVTCATATAAAAVPHLDARSLVHMNIVAETPSSESAPTSLPSSNATEQDSGTRPSRSVDINPPTGTPPDAVPSKPDTDPTPTLTNSRPSGSTPTPSDPSNTSDIGEPSVNSTALVSTTITQSIGSTPFPTGVDPSTAGNQTDVETDAPATPTGDSSVPSSSDPTPTNTNTTSLTPTPTNTPTTPPAVQTQVYLSEHNKVRSAFGTDDLTWSSDLADAAQTYANGCQLQHSGGDFGENLAAATGDFDAGAAVQLFVQDQTRFSARRDIVLSHFTQVVWKSTTELGCGVALCEGMFPDHKAPAVYHVCFYNPVGNVVGLERDNLLDV